MADAKRKATPRHQTRQRCLPVLPFKQGDGLSAVVMLANWIVRRCVLLQEAVERDIAFPCKTPCRVERLLFGVWYPQGGPDSLRDLRRLALSEISEPHLSGIFHPLIERLWKLYEGFDARAGQFLDTSHEERQSGLRRFHLGFLGEVCEAANAIFDQAGLLPAAWTSEAGGQGGKVDDGTSAKLAPKAKETTTVETQKPLQRCEKLAYYAAEYAEWKLENELEAKGAWDYLREHGFDLNDREFEYAAELTNYTVPDNFATFERYLATARTSFGVNRYEKRKGRSVVGADEI